MNKRSMVTVEDLQKTDLFSGLDRGILATIASFSSICEFSDGDVILSENASQDFAVRDLFLLISGTVSVKKSMPSCAPFKEIDVQAMDEEVYGEIGWLLGTAPSAEVTSRGDIRMLVVDGKQLFTLCESNLEVGYNILYRLAATLAVRLVNNNKL